MCGSCLICEQKKASEIERNEKKKRPSHTQRHPTVEERDLTVRQSQVHEGKRGRRVEAKKYATRGEQESNTSPRTGLSSSAKCVCFFSSRMHYHIKRVSSVTTAYTKMERRTQAVHSKLRWQGGGRGGHKKKNPPRGRSSAQCRTTGSTSREVPRRWNPHNKLTLSCSSKAKRTEPHTHRQLRSAALSNNAQTSQTRRLLKKADKKN